MVRTTHHQLPATWSKYLHNVFPCSPAYRTDVGEQRIVISVSVRVFVCRDHIFRTTRPSFTKFFVHVTYGRSSVLLWLLTENLVSFHTPITFRGQVCKNTTSKFQTGRVCPFCKMQNTPLNRAISLGDILISSDGAVWSWVCTHTSNRFNPTRSKDLDTVGLHLIISNGCRWVTHTRTVRSFHPPT